MTLRESTVAGFLAALNGLLYKCIILHNVFISASEFACIPYDQSLHAFSFQCDNYDNFLEFKCCG